MPTFTPPVVAKESPAGGGRLFVRYGLARGITVLQNQDGTFTQTRYPDIATLNAAKAYWVGGYTYVIDDATATALANAGYSVAYTGYDNTYDNVYGDA